MTDKTEQNSKPVGSRNISSSLSGKNKHNGRSISLEYMGLSDDVFYERDQTETSMPFDKESRSVG